jgi:hypothetical protein
MAQTLNCATQSIRETKARGLARVVPFELAPAVERNKVVTVYEIKLSTGAPGDWMASRIRHEVQEVIPRLVKQIATGPKHG